MRLELGAVAREADLGRLEEELPSKPGRGHLPHRGSQTPRSRQCPHTPRSRLRGTCGHHRTQLRAPHGGAPPGLGFSEQLRLPLATPSAIWRWAPVHLPHPWPRPLGGRGVGTSSLPPEAREAEPQHGRPLLRCQVLCSAFLNLWPVALCPPRSPHLLMIFPSRKVGVWAIGTPVSGMPAAWPHPSLHPHPPRVPTAALGSSGWCSLSPGLGGEMSSMTSCLPGCPPVSPPGAAPARLGCAGLPQHRAAGLVPLPPSPSSAEQQLPPPTAGSCPPSSLGAQLHFPFVLPPRAQPP